MNISYFANQIYEFSNLMPIYQRIGGTFIVRKPKRFFQFKYYLRKGSTFSESGTLLTTPRVRVVDVQNLSELEGVVISASNSRLHCERDKCKTIFVGHGTGDKKYGGDPKTLETYDYLFVTGRKHMEKLRDVGVRISEDKLVKIGNLRFDDYINCEIDRGKYLDRLGVIDRRRKNILYAPTWKWGSGTLHRYVYRFCKEITKEFNLIVRPHFHERQHIPKIKVWTKLHRIKHVYFSNPADVIQHDTMYDFAVSDLLISDTSSILYEYLITGNPVIVVESGYNDLHTMPESMDIRHIVERYYGESHSSILDLVIKTFEARLRTRQYKRLLKNCFYFNDGHSIDRTVEFLESIGFQNDYSRS